MDEEKNGGEPAATNGQQAPEKPKVLGQVVGKRMLSFKDRLKRKLMTKPSKKAVLIAAAGVLIIGGVAGSIVGYSRYKTQRQVAQINKISEAIANKDTSAAYKLAKQAVESDPNNMDNLLAAATIAEKEDPEESKRLYSRILELQSKDDNPEEDGKTANTYWSSAVLAEKAGKIELARKYYQKAIGAADMKDSYHQFIANDSQTALERLK